MDPGLCPTHRWAVLLDQQDAGISTYLEIRYGVHCCATCAILWHMREILHIVEHCGTLVNIVQHCSTLFNMFHLLNMLNNVAQC